MQVAALMQGLQCAAQGLQMDQTLFYVNRTSLKNVLEGRAVHPVLQYEGQGWRLKNPEIRDQVGTGDAPEIRPLRLQFLQGLNVFRDGFGEQRERIRPVAARLDHTIQLTERGSRDECFNAVLIEDRFTDPRYGHEMILTD